MNRIDSPYALPESCVVCYACLEAIQRDEEVIGCAVCGEQWCAVCGLALRRCTRCGAPARARP